MIITNIKRTDMKNINGSNNVFYSALLNGNQLIQYETDGYFNKHLTSDEFVDYIKENLK